MLPSIPSINPSIANALNVLQHQSRYVDFNWNELALKFHFYSTPSRQVIQQGFVLKIGHTDVKIGLNNWPDLQLEGVDAVITHLNGLPLLVAQSILEIALKPLLEILSKALGQPVSLKSIFFEPIDELDTHIRLDWGLLDVEMDTPYVLGSLWVDEDMLFLIAETWRKIDLRVNQSFENVLYTLRADIGHQWLSALEYRSLRLQDIIFLDAAHSPTKGHVHVYLGHNQAFLAQYEASTLIFKNWMDFSMAESQTTLTKPLNELPIDIHFSIGEKTLTFGELQALKSGYTFEFEALAADTVKLYVGRQMIGQGALVEVGDRLGVRLTALGEAINVIDNHISEVVLSTDEDRE